MGALLLFKGGLAFFTLKNASPRQRTIFCVQHTSFDGLTTAELLAFALSDVMKQKTTPGSGKDDNAAVDDVVELDFDVDDEIRDKVEICRTNHSDRLETFSAELFSFAGFGKNRIKEFKVHPDTFVQVALQVAAYRTHQR